MKTNGCGKRCKIARKKETRAAGYLYSDYIEASRHLTTEITSSSRLLTVLIHWWVLKRRHSLHVHSISAQWRRRLDSLNPNPCGQSLHPDRNDHMVLVESSSSASQKSRSWDRCMMGFMVSFLGFRRHFEGHQVACEVVLHTHTHTHHCFQQKWVIWSLLFNRFRSGFRFPPDIWEVILQWVWKDWPFQRPLGVSVFGYGWVVFMITISSCSRWPL